MSGDVATFPDPCSLDPLEVANLLVHESRVPVSRIARVLGFDAVEPFEAWFRRRTGAPARREQARGDAGSKGSVSMATLRQAFMGLLSEERIRELLRRLGNVSGRRRVSAVPSGTKEGDRPASGR